MHTLRLLWICTCLLFLGVAVHAEDDTCINTDEGYIYHIERAGYLRGEGRYDAALFNYQCAYLVDSNVLPIVRGIGYVNIELGQLNTALPYFQSAMNLAPNDAISNFDLGRMIALQAERDIGNGVDYNDLMSNFQQAVSYYNRAEEIDPSLSIVYYNRGVAFYDVKNYPAALKELQTALNLQVEPIYRTQFALATIYYEQEDYNSAWDYFQRTAINSNGKFALEDIVPPGLSYYRTNTDIERFAKRNLPIVLFFIVTVLTLGYSLIRRLRKFWANPSSEAANTLLESVPPPEDLVISAVSASEPPPRIQEPESGFPWWQTVLFVPVVVGGLYAIQRWITGDDA